jgi:hypothetical protein
MKKIIPVAASALLFLAPVAANAAGTGTGAASGAVAGAVVGGPIGAVVGGVLGAVIGTAIDPPPPQVVAYVETQELPPPVELQGSIALGATIPEPVALYPIPPDVYVPVDNHIYAYAYINGQRVIVDTQTRAIVAVVG